MGNNSGFLDRYIGNGIYQFQNSMGYNNRGDNLKDKQSYKKIWALLVHFFFFYFYLLIYSQKKNVIPISIVFEVITLQNYRDSKERCQDVK